MNEGKKGSWYHWIKFKVQVRNQLLAQTLISPVVNRGTLLMPTMQRGRAERSAGRVRISNVVSVNSKYWLQGSIEHRIAVESVAADCTKRCSASRPAFPWMGED